MDNIEEKILDVINDPEKLEQIMGIAKGLGFTPPENDVSQEQHISTPPLEPFLNLLQANHPDGKQEALFQALMPYLRPSRQKKLQRALKVAKISQLAGFALKNYAEEL